jgi:chemotaxis methyl-accepting protein methylase
MPQPTDEHAARAGGAGLAADALDAVLELLRERDGVDLSGYRRATLGRRVRSRMASAGAATLGEYLERLRADPAETALLLDRITCRSTLIL